MGLLRTGILDCECGRIRRPEDGKMLTLRRDGLG
jgi:hypothetical protein